MSRDGRFTITLLAVTGTVLLIGAASSPTVNGAPLPPELPVCIEEDGSGPTQELPCLWDGTKRGNKQGVSFIINQDATITYL